MDGPDSSYSDLAIHICWKVDSEARMEPPIQTEYFRSGGATTLIIIDVGASAVILRPCVTQGQAGPSAGIEDDPGSDEYESGSNACMPLHWLLVML